MKSELDWGPIHVDGGKYTFQPADDGYSVDILRYGNPWFTVTQGCNAVRALAFEVEALRETIAPRQAVFPAAAVRRGPVNQSVVMRSKPDLSKFTAPASEVAPKRKK